MNNSEKLYATDPRLVAFANVLESSAVTGQWRWGVVSASRTEAEQQKLYSQGRTSPGNIVTYASRPDESPHVLWQGQSDAVDFAPRNDSNTDYDWGNDAAFQALGDLAQQQGLVWGGNFPGFADDSHVETPDWRARRRRQAKGNTVVLLTVMALLALSNCVAATQQPTTCEQLKPENMKIFDFETQSLFPLQIYQDSSPSYGIRVAVLSIGGIIDAPYIDTDPSIYTLAYKDLNIQYIDIDTGATISLPVIDDSFHALNTRSIFIPTAPTSVGQSVTYRVFVAESANETLQVATRQSFGSVTKQLTVSYPATAGVASASPPTLNGQGLPMSGSPTWEVIATGYKGGVFGTPVPLSFGFLRAWKLTSGFIWSRDPTNDRDVNTNSDSQPSVTFTILDSHGWRPTPGYLPPRMLWLPDGINSTDPSFDTVNIQILNTIPLTN